MAIEKQSQTTPVVDDSSPVPTQVPSKGQDDQASEGTEQRAEPPSEQAPAASSADEPARPPTVPEAAAVPQRTPTEPTLPMPIRVRTADESRHEPLPVRAQLRRAELEALLADTDDARTRDDIERALASLAQLLTGDTEHLSAPTAAALNRWLEGARHLGVRAPSAEPERRAS